MFRLGKLLVSSLLLFLFVVGCGSNNSNQNNDVNKVEAKSPSKSDQKKALNDYENELLNTLKSVTSEWDDVINSDELNPQNMMMSRYDDHMRDDLTKKIQDSQHQFKMYSERIAKLEIPKSLSKSDQDTVTNAIISLSNSFGTMNEILTKLQDIGTTKDKYEQQIAVEDIKKLTSDLDNGHSEFETTLNGLNQKYGIEDLNYFSK